MSVISNNALAGSSGQGGGGGYEIERSLRFNYGDSAYLNRTPSSAGSLTTWTWSAWVKNTGQGSLPCLFGGGTASDRFFLRYKTGGAYEIFCDPPNGAATERFSTNAVFRDFSAWAHFVLVWDTTNATALDRCRFYVNGVLQQLDGTFSQNIQSSVNNNSEQLIGKEPGYSRYFNGYLADIQFIDGQALAASDFGEYDDNNVWQPIEFDGTYSTAAIGTLYSAYGTGTAYNATHTWAEAFNGTISTTGATHAFPGSSQTLTWTPPSPITVNTSATFYVYNQTDGSSYGCKVNGSYLAASSAYGNPQTKTAAELGGQISSIELVNSGLLGPYLTAVEVDGTVLTDGTSATGTNSFHLDFSDISSNAALGFDSSSTGLNRIETGNVSNGVPVLGSMNFSNAGANAVHLRDNNTSTSAADGGGLTTSTNMGYDFLIPYKVRKIETIGDSSGNGVTYSSVFNIQYSDDGSTWTTVTGSNTTHPITAGSGQVDQTTIDDNGAHRYWRIYYSSSSNTGGNIWIASLNMFADDIGANNWFVNNLTAASGVGPGITSTVPEDLTGNWTGIIGIVPTDTSGAVAVFPDGGGTAQSRGTFYWTGLTVGDTITWYGTSSGQTRSVVGNVNETSVSVPGGSLGSFQLTVSAASGSAKVDFNGTASCYGITPGPVSSEYNDALRDTPVNGDSANDTGAGGEITGNYCTLNPLAKGPSATLSNGNLDISSGAAWDSTYGTIGVTSGKWYWEQTMTTNQYTYTGIDYDINTTNYPGNTASSWAYLSSDNSIYNSGTAGPTVGPMPSGGGIIGVALDLDNRTLSFSINGVFANSADPATNSNPHVSNLPIGKTWFPAVDTFTSSTVMNFGQRPFAYTAPSGYKALCTANLSDPTIADGSTAFDTKLYTGNLTARSITGLGFNPDLVWIKLRSGAGQHVLTDSIRGTDKQLFTSLTNAEQTSTTAITSFNSDGFSLGTQIVGSGDTNNTGSTYAAWAWDAGSSTVTNTDGSISSQVRANPSAGFSIVSYTGAVSSPAKVGHGLNATPAFVIVKPRSTSDFWVCYHSAFNDLSKYIILSSTNAVGTAASNYWGTSSDWNSSTFGVYPTAGSNNNIAGVSHVAYCFAPVEGYSAFGSYTGNGSADGPFVFTGFRPRWIMIKTTANISGNWYILDTARDSVNVMPLDLYANDSAAESTITTNQLDALSNGFKLRGAGGGMNGSGHTLIYAAFAENPFKTSRAR